MAEERIVLAMTGASGAPYGLRLLGCLLEAGKSVDFLISEPGQIVVGMESELRLSGSTQEMQKKLCAHYQVPAERLKVWGRQQWTAPMASGSGAPAAMVICPCSIGTLSAIACGLSRNLIERGADVVLKEQKKLILVPRETPFSSIHLENMLRLARMGAVIMPPNPGFYFRPSSVEDIVDFVVARLLDHLQVPHKMVERWGARDPVEEP